MSRGRTKRKLAKAIRFAELRAQGRTQLDAWRAINQDWDKCSPEAQHQAAYRFNADPLVKAQCDKALDAVSINAFMSAQRYAAWLQDCISGAQGRENDTAVMAGARILGSTLGHLRDNLTVDSKNIPIDKLLADAVAAGMPLAAAKRLLGVVDATPGTDSAANPSQVVALVPRK